MRSLRPLGEGDFCVAFRLNRDWVVRAAKHGEAAASLKREACLLPRLAPRLDLAIPVPEFAHADRTAAFVVYRLLPGVPLTRGRFLRLAEHQQARCAARIARFLSRLHATDLAEARDCGIPTAGERDRYGAVMARSRTELTLPARDREFVEQAYAGYLGALAVAPAGVEPVLLHGDLSPEHVLVHRATGEVTGVIDFGDMAIGDPAWDFVYLAEDYGAEMLGRVAAAYVEHDQRRLDPLVDRVLALLTLTALEWALSRAEHAPAELRAALAGLGRLRLRRPVFMQQTLAAAGTRSRS